MSKKLYRFYNEIIIEADSEAEAIEQFANNSSTFAPDANREEICFECYGKTDNLECNCK